MLHNCLESSASNLEEVQRDDMIGVQSLFNELGLRELVAKEALVGCRRLGQKKDNHHRPLLLIFKTRNDRDKLLDRAPRLSRHQEEEYSNISIVADLTQKQRKLEQDMFKRAEKLNLERSSDMISKNLCHKVIGRRGERVLRQVEMRENEAVNEAGKVVNKEEVRSQEQRSTVQKPRIFAASQTRIWRQDVVNIGVCRSKDEFDIADSFGIQHHSILYSNVQSVLTKMLEF